MSAKNPCEGCDAKCCRYFALEIDKPKSERDFDDIRWFLAHENTRVFVEEGGWFLEVQNVCRYLDEHNRCRIYEDRPALCREHSTTDCEGHDELDFEREHEFNSPEELARFAQAHLAKRERKRRKKDKKKGKRKRGDRKGKDQRDHAKKGRKPSKKDRKRKAS